MKRILLVVVLGATLSTVSTRVLAQRTNTSPLDSARAALSKPDKDPTTATVLSFVPGVGHLYAEDINRGWLIMAVYWTGVAITHNGRTDNVGKVGGVMLLGGLVFSVADAGSAARRYNRRMAKLREAARADSLGAGAHAR